MLKRYDGKIYNSDLKVFFCKNCHKGVNHIYKDEKGNSYCEDCKPKE